MGLRSFFRRGGVGVLRLLPTRARAVVLRGGRFVVAELAPPPPRPAPVELLTSQTLPLPAGLDEERLRSIWATWSIDGEPAGHMDPYVGDSFCRFLHTYGLLVNQTGRCLELGANPYFTTYLLDDFTQLDLTLANYFGEEGGSATQSLAYVDGDGVQCERKYTFDQFNIEDSRFPYEDGSFDVVVFAEILEHLLMDPVAVLLEIRRILTPTGTLVLTTPNVARVENAFRVVAGENIYDPYSGYGPYGRHNREYTTTELRRLLSFVGFDVQVAFTADGHPTEHRHHPNYEQIAPLLAGRPDQLGGYLFARAVKRGDARDGLPDFLYRSYPPGRVVET